MLDLPEVLSPSIVNSFAYLTFKDRLPVIIVKIIDSLYRHRHEIIKHYGEGSGDKVKYITSELSKCRHELTTNKALVYFTDNILGDEKLWNSALDEEARRLYEPDGKIYWFKTSFLFGENYLYRRIYDIVLKSNLKGLDPFKYEKNELIQRSMVIHQNLTEYLLNIVNELPEMNDSQLKQHFEVFIKMSLWANEADLSLSINEEDGKLQQRPSPEIVRDNNTHLLVDDYADVLQCLLTASQRDGHISSVPPPRTTMTVMLDNSGSELLADLHWVVMLLRAELIQQVTLIGKSMPWYVSDVTRTDFQTTLDQLNSSDNSLLHSFYGYLQHYLSNGQLCYKDHWFVTLPYPYNQMSSICPDLYHQLASQTIVVFKGDLNYRKLVSDRMWPLNGSITFAEALQGFLPCRMLVALRVLKCDTVAGLGPTELDRIDTEQLLVDNKWMYASKYGLIQIATRAD